MDKDGTSLVGLVVVLIIIAIVLWFVFGGTGLGSFGRFAGAYLPEGGCNRTSNCEVEKQGIIDSARTQYLIERKNNESTMAITQKLDAQYQANQAEKLFDCKMNALKSEILTAQAMNAKDQEIAMLKLIANTDSKYRDLSTQIETFSCQTPKRPPFYATGTYCNPCCG